MKSYQKEDILTVAKSLVDFYSTNGKEALKDLATELGLPLSEISNPVSFVSLECAMSSIRNLSMEDKVISKRLLNRASSKGSGHINLVDELDHLNKVLFLCGLE